MGRIVLGMVMFVMFPVGVVLGFIALPFWMLWSVGDSVLELVDKARAGKWLPEGIVKDHYE